MRFFKVTIQTGGADATREVIVPSKTSVQAADAATALMKPGEAVVSIEESLDPDVQRYHRADGPPPGTQTHPDKPV